MGQVGFPGSSDCKESACDVGDPGSIPGPGRSLGEGNGYSLQYMGNSMGGEAWWAIVHGVAKSRTRLSNSTATTTMGQAVREMERETGYSFCPEGTSFQ